MGRKVPTMKTIRAKLPDKLYQQVDALVKQCWFGSHDDIVNQALRRFLEHHRPEDLEKMFRDDVEWGLHGKT
jgi:Arc/MetJ-type ribon-helix-helix transcriptional regulator